MDQHLSHKMMFRSIARLRSGLPPVEILETISVDSQSFVDKINLSLETKKVSNNWMLICGNYGEGKSHALALLSEIAHKNNYATCIMSADANMNALNHPQRFLASLLETLELPGSSEFGYFNFILSLLSNSVTTESIIKLMLKNLSDNTLFFHNTLISLKNILKCHKEISSNSDISCTEDVYSVASNLAGFNLTNKPGNPSNRRISYELLALARDLIIHAGYSGLVIEIDEVESIYTKLTNSRSRFGAVRTISALSSLECPLAIAITPDALRNIKYDTSSVFNKWDCVGPEINSEWRDAVKTGHCYVYKCTQLSAASKKKIVENIRSVYEKTYGAMNLEFKTLQIWDQHVQSCHRGETPIRILLRQTVNLLDYMRYSANTTDSGRSDIN